MESDNHKDTVEHDNFSPTNVSEIFVEWSENIGYAESKNVPVAAAGDTCTSTYETMSETKSVSNQGDIHVEEKGSFPWKSVLVTCMVTLNFIIAVLALILVVTVSSGVNLRQETQVGCTGLEERVSTLESIATKEKNTTTGTVYTRWGSSHCPNITGTELVYSGRAGGPHWNQPGGGINRLCLPADPEYTPLSESDAEDNQGVHSTEYQRPITGGGRHEFDAPCAVCHMTTRETVLMIPAKMSCPSSWTREYFGYLMSDRINQQRSTFECFDRSQEVVPGTGANQNGALLYHVQASCSTGLPCPPYDSSLVLNCVVCSK